jgi:hypothetical protein
MHASRAHRPSSSSRVGGRFLLLGVFDARTRALMRPAGSISTHGVEPSVDETANLPGAVTEVAPA